MAHLKLRRRQRRATLDLLALPAHRRRDLGLDDFSFGARW